MVVGIAWFDDEPPPMAARELRIGGLPLLPDEVAWPTCSRCDLPMLFRAQVPLALTSLTSFEDDRVIEVFECHATPLCDAAVALVVGGELRPRPAPKSEVFDVLLHSVGARPEAVLRVVDALADHPAYVALRLPLVLLGAAPPSIAREAVRALQEAGGAGELRSSPPTLLGELRGGRMMPFDDALPGLSRTTLPPLHEITGSILPRVPIRGVFGGYGPGGQNLLSCGCGRPTRTAVRLFAQPVLDDLGPEVGPVVIQICPPCGVASAHRAAPAGMRLAS